MLKNLQVWEFPIIHLAHCLSQIERKVLFTLNYIPIVA